MTACNALSSSNTAPLSEIGVTGAEERWQGMLSANVRSVTLPFTMTAGEAE
jgi:hypothetical protein